MTFHDPAASATDTPPTTPSHDAKGGALRRVGVVALGIVVVLVAIVVGILAFLATALVIPVSPVMFGVMIVVGALAAFGLSLLVFRRTRRRRAAGSWARRTRVTQVVTGVAAAALIGVTVIAHLPLTGLGRGPEASGIAYADISTGSRLAYWETPATVPSDESPIVFLHGGPGSFQAGTVPLLDELADDGFDLYYYDQAGAGHSSFLERDEYSVERLVADLDAFREEVVGSDRITVIGHSFGGYFAEAYAAAHPEAVDRVVLATPLVYENSFTELTPEDEAIDAEDSARAEGGAERAAQIPFSTLVRAGIFYVLQSISPAAADSYLSQDDLLRFDIVGGGSNALANAQIGESAVEGIDSVLESVREDGLPTLVLRSEHDYVYWPELRLYRDLNPNATLVYIPERDHQILWEGSEETSPLEAIRTFLLDEPQAGVVYDGSQDPRIALGDG